MFLRFSKPSYYSRSLRFQVIKSPRVVEDDDCEDDVCEDLDPDADL